MKDKKIGKQYQAIKRTVQCLWKTWGHLKFLSACEMVSKTLLLGLKSCGGINLIVTYALLQGIVLSSVNWG